MPSPAVTSRGSRHPLALISAAALTVALPIGMLIVPPSGASAETPPGATTVRAEATPVSGRASTNPVTPGDFTGYGFDQCLAPTQKAMNAWRQSSPFWAVGIYTSGNSRACRSQPNLTPAWVRTQLRKGWRLLPITLGPQAYCNSRYPKYNDDPVIKRDPAKNYKAARLQGVAEARTAVAAAGALGIVPGSTLWYDLEAFDIGNSGCRLSAMRFLHGWTMQVRRMGYVSGAYSSGASGIKAIDDARVNDPKFAEPDALWIADWSGTPFGFRGSWLRDGAFEPGGRMHQYRGGHLETHGGVTINIDSNWLDLGAGHAAPPPTPRCDGVRVSFKRYYPIPSSNDGPLRLKAAQCLLKEAGHYSGRLSGVYDAKTSAAVAAFRSDRSLAAGTTISNALWMSLLSAGPRPLLKEGVGSESVRRVQRALNAAGSPQLKVHGRFDGRTTAAVKAYQSQVGLPATGVVNSAFWSKLAAGNR